MNDDGDEKKSGLAAETIEYLEEVNKSHADAVQSHAN
jgi:hypothetical protein